jgi:hypothetical protein
MTATDPLHRARPTDSPHNAWRAGYRHAWNDAVNGLESRKDEANPYLDVDPVKRRVSWLTVAQTYRLNAACIQITRTFDGNCPYLVGSVLHRPDFHDVDVRLMLPDEEFARLFPTEQWLLLANTALSETLERATSLPIDFQFQDTTQANAEYVGIRHALGMDFA